MCKMQSSEAKSWLRWMQGEATAKSLNIFSSCKSISSLFNNMLRLEIATSIHLIPQVLLPAVRH